MAREPERGLSDGAPGGAGPHPARGPDARVVDRPGRRLTYIRDNAPFTISFGGAQLEEGLVAVGWLDASSPFERGPVPADAVERLRQLCRQGVNRTRGWHRCTLCTASGGVELPRPTTVADASGEFVVGSAEIRVEGPTGTTYAAPNMIIHYVEEHGYRPPEDFVAGLTRE